MGREDNNIDIGQEIDEKIQVICGYCRTNTNHKIINDAVLKSRWIDDEHGEVFSSTDKFQIIQCQGCDDIVFRRTSSNSEDYFHRKDGTPVHNVKESIFPNPKVKRSPIKDDHLLPSVLFGIYEETLSSLNNNMPILTGIGIRAIVEVVCKELDIVQGNLKRKIDDLVTKQVLTKDGADILHKLRNMGNSAAHEAKPHTGAELDIALDVLDHLLNSVFIIPHHAKKLPAIKQ
jgi:Domain of unknown function (DUF4145)